MSIKKPHINFIFSTRKWKNVAPLLKEEIAFTFEKAAEALNSDFSRKEVSLVLTSDKEVQKLNKIYRHKDEPTNVLSFSSVQENELGDIVLAYETVMKEAEDLGVSPLHHTLHLIVHGFLHLLGYDHENNGDAAKMEALEIKTLKALNVQNPYED